MSIKSETIRQIEEVLKHNQKYYRIYDFPFPTNRNGYSTHQGAVLRNYLRAKGYVNVRVSEISQKFFTDNQDSINASLRGKTVTQVFLKPSNTIIIKIEDYLQYKANMFSAKNFNKNVKTFENIFQPSKLAGDNVMVLLPPMHHTVPQRLKPAIIGMGKEKLDNAPVIRLMTDKYKDRLDKLKKYHSLNIDDLTLQESSDLEQRIADLAEIVRDLKSIS